MESCRHISWENRENSDLSFNCHPYPIPSSIVTARPIGLLFILFSILLICIHLSYIPSKLYNQYLIVSSLTCVIIIALTFRPFSLVQKENYPIGTQKGLPFSDTCWVRPGRRVCRFPSLSGCRCQIPWLSSRSISHGGLDSSGLKNFPFPWGKCFPASSSFLKENDLHAVMTKIQKFIEASL